MEEKKETILEALLRASGDEAPIVTAIEEDTAEPGDLPRLLEESRLAKAGAITELAKRAMYWDAKRKALEAFFLPYLEAYQQELDYCESRADRARLGIATLLPSGEELVSDDIAITWRKSQRGEIVDKEAIPVEFLRIKDPEPNLEELKAAAKAGKQIPGYELRTNFSLQIKPGGARAKANQRAREKKRIAGGSDDE